MSELRQKLKSIRDGQQAVNPEEILDEVMQGGDEDVKAAALKYLQVAKENPEPEED